MIAGIVEIGRELVGVKGRVGYKGYVEFVTQRLGWSDRQGDRFVSVYQMFTDKLSVDGLTIDASSLYQIAAPSTPDEVSDLV